MCENELKLEMLKHYCSQIISTVQASGEVTMGNTHVKATMPTVSKGELKWDFRSGGNVKLGVSGK